jgi:hypothetical protein
MRKAVLSDKSEFLRIISESYRSNPSVLWVLKKDRKIESRLSVLAEYCWKEGLLQEGIYFSKNGDGIAIFYPLHEKKSGIKSLFWQLRLVIRAIGISRIGTVLRRDSYIAKNRSAHKCIYFWMYAVDPKSRDGIAAREIRDFAFQMADEQRLPILAETSVPQNKKVYEHFGFQTYHQWEDPKSAMVTWFMQRLPHQK